jgi:hypothetical protein
MDEESGELDEEKPLYYSIILACIHLIFFHCSGSTFIFMCIIKKGTDLEGSCPMKASRKI